MWMKPLYPVNRRVLMYGGVDAGVVRNDFWSWDGAAWTQRTPPAKMVADRYTGYPGCGTST